jgi:hypothetical protein
MSADAAEIARLRAALEKIAAISPSRTIALLPTARQAAHYWNAFIQCRTIALVALKPQP